MSKTPYAPGFFLFGGDYNPEQWSREVWAEDIALMTQSKVNTVTLGVFAWAMLEPREGVYDAEWLDEIIGLLHDAGIGFFLATPTASPPPWFSANHPDGLPVRADGTRLTHGSRDTYAVSAPSYREACRRVARFLADRYGAHPGLRGWHVHNEYGTIDYGPHAAAAFRRWLQARYGRIEALNEAWYTAFWSQRYDSWDEIEPPRVTQYLHNPAQVVDFKRFCSDEMLAAFGEQKQEIRAAGSTAPVTTNFMLPTWNHLEQWSWSDAQDAVSIDHYLDDAGPEGDAHVAYGSDLTRSWAGGTWLLMEQNAVGIRLGHRTVVKEPAKMIRNSLGYIARGAQSSLFFQWRASAGGSEQWHGALVPHTGADTDAFRAVVELGGILERLTEVGALPTEGPIVDARVGIVWHAEGWWSLETPHLPNDALDYSDEVRPTHRSLWRAGHAVDFVRPGAAVSDYPVLVVPALPAMSSADAAWLRSYVEAGGHLVVSFFTGVLDEHERVIPGGFPGRLRELIGVRVEEFRPLDPGGSVVLGNGAKGEMWSEKVHLEGASVLTTYAEGDLAGWPAITRRQVGEGTVTYVSTRLRQEDRDAFLAELVRDAGIAPTVPGASALGVEAVRRRGRTSDYLFLLHHGTAAVRIEGQGTDLITGSDAPLTLEPGAVAVIRESGTAWTLSAA